MLALPAQMRRLRQRLLHHRRGVDEDFHVRRRGRDQPARQRLQALLDEIVIVVALRIDRDRRARSLLEDRQRIGVGTVIDAEHDHAAHVLPQPARIDAALRLSCEPIHVAMAARCDEFEEVFAGTLDRARRSDADAVEAKRARFAGKRRLQFSRIGAQKSRST